MKATRSGIVIGLALALLVPTTVVGQEASPSAEPSVGPSPSPEVVASPEASPEASCPPEAAAVTEYEALVSELDAETAAAIDDWGSAKGDEARRAATDRLLVAADTFRSGVEALVIPPETLKSFNKPVGDLFEEYMTAKVMADAGGVPLDEKVKFRKSNKAVKAIRTTLAELDPCASPDAPEPSPEASSEQSTALRDITALTKGKHPKTSLKKVGNRILARVESDADKLATEAVAYDGYWAGDFRMDPAAFRKAVKNCQAKVPAGYTKSDGAEDLRNGRSQFCLRTVSLLTHAYGLTRDDAYYELADAWVDAMYTDMKLPKLFKGFLRDELQQTVQSFPEWFEE